MNDKITHLNFNFNNKVIRYTYYFMTAILFFLYVILINFEIKSFNFIRIINNLNSSDIIIDLLKSLLYMIFMIFIISLTPGLMHNLHPKLKYRIGRNTILFGLTTMAFYVFYFLMAKNTTNKVM